jgi:hypothetical protein
MAHGDLYGELMGARTERQVAVTVERYLRRVADEHPRGFLVALEKGVGVLPFLTTASRVRSAADIELLHATVTGHIEIARSRGEVPPGLEQVAEILAAARVRLKQLRRPWSSN